MPEPDLISVIIAVCNDERHLPRMLRCVCAQTYENLEIVLVDDGSTDGTPAICDEWAARDSRITVYHIENGGVAHARNFALDRIHGRYFAFADADDLMDDRLIERLYALLGEHGVAISACEASDVSDKDAPEAYALASPFEEGFLVTPQSIEFTARWSHRVIWGALFDAFSLGHMRFDESYQVSTDTLFMAQCLLEAGSMAQTHDRLYCYVLYTSSVSHGTFGPRRYDDVRVWRRVRNLYLHSGGLGYRTAAYNAFRKDADALFTLDAQRKCEADQQKRTALTSLMRESARNLRGSFAVLRETSLGDSRQNWLIAAAPYVALRVLAARRTTRYTSS